MLFAAILGIICDAIQFAESYWVVLGCRFFIGIVCGSRIVSGLRYVEEYVPTHLYATMCAILYASIGLGVQTASGVPITEPFLKSQYYRLYFTSSMISDIIILVLIIFCIKMESPKFYLAKD